MLVRPVGNTTRSSSSSKVRISLKKLFTYSSKALLGISTISSFSIYNKQNKVPISSKKKANSN